MNEYRGDQNVTRKLLTVDGNDNFLPLTHILSKWNVNFEKPEIYMCKSLTVSTD